MIKSSACSNLLPDKTLIGLETKVFGAKAEEVGAVVVA